MMTAALIALLFLGLAVVPCCIGLYIRSSLKPTSARPGSEVLTHQ